MAADLPSWKRKRIQVLIRGINGIPKHSEEMKTKAHDCVFEYIDSDPGNPRMPYPKWGFGQRQQSDMYWFKQVWQYCRLPHDMSEDIAGHTALETRPDSETFLTRVFLPEGTTWKRALAIIIADDDTNHNNYMLQTALNCLAYCLQLETPNRPGSLRLPLKAFGERIHEPEQWLKLVFRYAIVPEDAEWEGSTSTLNDGGSVPSNASIEDTKRAAVVEKRETQVPGDSDNVVPGTTKSYTEVLAECEIHKKVANRGIKGRDALETAFAIRSPHDKRYCRIPNWGFEQAIYNDATWFRLVYDNGCLPGDMSFCAPNDGGANKKKRVW